MLPQLAINIIRKDWAEYWKTVILLTAGMFLPLLVVTGSKDFSQGLMVGIIISGSYGYAHFCFMTERLRGTLQLLLGLPVKPFNLVLAKFASLYSMALFTTNLPGIFMRDLRVLFLLNALVLILSTVCMAATVVSEKPWAPIAPVWIVLIFFMPMQRLLAKVYPGGLALYALAVSHATLLAGFALILAPIIALLSAAYFHRRFTFVD